MKIPRFPFPIMVVVFVAISLFTGTSHAETTHAPQSIALGKGVYFLTPDGSPVLVDPGSYTVEAGEEWLRLIPGQDRRGTILIETQRGTHETPLDRPRVRSLAGSGMNEPDLHLIQWQNPDGTSLVAMGTYSGIQSRGLPKHMKKMLQLAKVLACASSSKSFCFMDEDSKSGGAHTTANAPQSWLTTATKDWMGRLPDSTPLNKISIPGTHDTGAQGEHGGIGVKTQPWSITEQLNAGIRYLDIRTRRTGSAFAIHHGPYFLDMMFGDVMNEVTRFLRNHPKEVILMRVKGDEKTAQSGSQSNTDIWEKYMNQKGFGRYVYTGDNTLPTLGEARGKIVVLRNISIANKYGVSYSNQSIQDKYKVYWLAHKHNKGDSVSLPSKKDVIKQYIAQANTLSANGKLVLNHLSGAVGMLPKDVARATNGTAYNDIGPYGGYTRNLGVLIMDYPGEKLVYRIIKWNFLGSGKCRPRTFRTVSAKTWAEFRLPSKLKGSIIAIKGGAYNRYVFPKCNRVKWSDLRFMCLKNGEWLKTGGSWGADALCHGSKGNSKYVFTGNR